MNTRLPIRARPGFRLIFTMQIRHWRSGKLIRRKDGRPFAFWVRSRT